MDLVSSVLSGDRLGLARLLSEVESGSQAGTQALNQLFPHTGKAQLIGVTGAPGTGKSSLVNQLALHYRRPPQGEPRRVAILAVDPSSPFTGGAVLGDRIRMRELSGDQGVFIRSMASRGSLGGLAAASAGAAQAFDAAGYDIILIETVGSGQSEVEIAKLAHTTLVVDVPGLGDDVQAIKAGILEIADILVLNKADRPGVESAERALQGMLKLGHPTKRIMHHGQVEEVQSADSEQAHREEWIPPIRRTVALEGKGVVELVEAIEGHRQFLQRSGEWQGRERARLQNEVELLLQSELMATWRRGLSPGQYEAVLDALMARQQSPRQAVAALLNGKAKR
ncbi:MAG: methylmalonyl Co-A mutase-associated GTPase MeaB [Anaerolineales bacterium]|nr:methylmalonyl Co-A mutase-associated GTPase MeaB [Anaerolineales bacterium]MCW5854616.1 methylmalonyl Co-A mutase-associated GTPase MeaB [Anaerolineales bacterium]